MITQAELAEFVRLMPAQPPLIGPRVRPPRRSISRSDVARRLRRAEHRERWAQLREALARRLLAGAAVEPGPISASARRVEEDDHLPLPELLAKGWVTPEQARLLQRDDPPPSYTYLYVKCEGGASYCTAVESAANSEGSTGTARID